MGGFDQPLPQYDHIVWIYILKADAHSQAWLRIEYGTLGLEISAL